MDKRNNHVDYVKGVMIILVVFGHITYFGELASYLYEIKSLIYVFHMPIFLAITGYYLSFNIVVGKFFKSISKLIVPYIVSFSLYLIILFFVSNYTAVLTSNNVKSISGAAYAIFVDPFASYWYLHSVILFYFIGFFSLGFVGKFCGKDWQLALGIVFYYVVHFTLFKLGFGFFFWVAAFLWLGYILKALKSKEANNKCLVAILVVFFLVSFSGGVKGFEIERVFFSLLVFTIFYIQSMFFSFNLISFIGRNSLMIFLFHVYFINLMKVFSVYFIQLDNSGLLFVVFSVFFSVIGSIGVGFLLDKLKLSRFILGVDVAVK